MKMTQRKAPKKSKPKTKAKGKRKSDVPFKKAFWKGSLSFGLVNIPIALITAEEKKRLHFHLLDKRDHGPIGYRNYNKKTGKDVDRKEIVKAFEYEKGKYVILNDTDFEKANVKATRTIEIEDFVSLNEVDPMLFERPYYVVPQKGAEKGYALLREVLKRTQKAAIARVVMHRSQHLVAIAAREDYLILEILRFANEVIQIHEAKFLDEKVNQIRVSERELAVAEQLVEGMTAAWEPEKYHDTYTEDVMRMIDQKVKRGGAVEVEPVKAPEPVTTNIVDLTSLLEKSLRQTKGKKKEAA